MMRGILLALLIAVLQVLPGISGVDAAPRERVGAHHCMHETRPGVGARCDGSGDFDCVLACAAGHGAAGWIGITPATGAAKIGPGHARLVRPPVALLPEGRAPPPDARPPRIA